MFPSCSDTPAHRVKAEETRAHWSLDSVTETTCPSGGQLPEPGMPGVHRALIPARDSDLLTDADDAPGVSVLRLALDFAVHGPVDDLSLPCGQLDGVYKPELSPCAVTIRILTE